MLIKKSIIPSAITMANMVSGFFAILLAAKYDPQQNNIDTLIIAGVLIFAASLFDVFDGAAARGLKVESEIGMQLDSFADAVSYGIAPAVISYEAFFYKLPLIFGLSSGAAFAAIFPICAIFRLARFNCEDSGAGFKGLPSPSAGMVIAIVPALFVSDNMFLGTIFFQMPLYVFMCLYISIAFLMVSNIDYSKLFSVIWKKGKIATAITGIVIIGLLIFFKAWSIFVVNMVYVLWGIVRYLTNHLFNSKSE